MLNGPRAAVLGQPVTHSLSPVLHRAAYDALGLTDWTFERHEVGTADLPRFLASLDGRWRGLALTMPLKETALALADVASDTARRTGAANTLVRNGDSWHADNTDVWGINAALLDAGVEQDAVERALVLGSGATARSAVAALSALGVREIAFGVRDRVRAETLRQAAAAGMKTSVIALDDVARIVADEAVTVSTLPPGGADEVAAALGEGSLTGRGVLLEVVYAGWPTPLATAAQSAGLTVAPGLEMLIHQAAAQVTSMTGRDAPLAAMQAAGRAAQRDQGA